MVRPSDSKARTGSERWACAWDGGKPPPRSRRLSTASQHPRRSSMGAPPSISWPSWDEVAQETHSPSLLPLILTNFHPSLKWDALSSQPHARSFSTAWVDFDVDSFILHPSLKWEALSSQSLRNTHNTTATDDFARCASEPAPTRSRRVPYFASSPGASASNKFPSSGPPVDVLASGGRRTKPLRMRYTSGEEERHL
ncbi:hypothetical protein T484DRAFT_1754078 [Baffinella frigidus]|nr:hypothetical protein T484DRAFT_1754078 [Cryptophyta sp. CCMP2293]